MADERPSVVVVGGGFAGIGCAKALAKHDVDVTLIDRNNFHQFQPLLYQVATAQAAPSDIASPLRDVFRKDGSVKVKKATVSHVDPETRTVTTAEGATFTGDYLVLAAGTTPNFFGVPGAEEHALPLYGLRDATRLRDRIFELFEEADTTPEVIDRGALNFVIVGGGPTGVETAGALIDLVDDVMAARFHDLDVKARARVIVVDRGQHLLNPFSDSAHAYVASVLEHRGVELLLEQGVAEVHPDRVNLTDGSSIPTRCVVWAGGVSPTALGLADDLTTGRGPRLRTETDLTLTGHPQVYAVGDVAQIAGADGAPLPQLGSVALQAGQHAAHNIRRHAAGKATEPFTYHDKGIMAMIGRGAAIAELGEKRHELHGHLAFSAWLGVHAMLMTGTRERIDLFVSWAWDYFSKNRAPSIVESVDEIDWDAPDDA